MSENKIKIKDDRGGDVNFQISQKCELITLTNGYKYVKDGFRVALPPGAFEGGTISAKLRDSDSDLFVDVPIYIGGFNDVILKEISTSDHSMTETTIFIGY